MQFDRGYCRRTSSQTPRRWSCELEDALVFIYEKKISVARDNAPILEKVVSAGVSRC